MTVPFMSQMTVSRTSFTHRYAWNIFNSMDIFLANYYQSMNKKNTRKHYLTLSLFFYLICHHFSNISLKYYLAPSPTPRCSSYRKGNLRVALDNGRQLYFTYDFWTLTKWLEKKLDGNDTRMLRAILNKSWQQHPTRHQLYGHLPPITKTIQVRRTRHARHCWRSRDDLISDILLWTPTYGRGKIGRPARTYVQQLCEDTGCGPEDLPEVMNDREKWRKRVRDIRVCGTTWWWWLLICLFLFWFDFKRVKNKRDNYGSMYRILQIAVHQKYA